MSKGEVKDRYPAVAVGHIINPGDDTASPPKRAQVEVEMRGLADGEDTHAEGKRFYLYLGLDEKSQEITAQTLRRLGWKCNDITKLEGLGSTKVQIVEKEREWKGKKYPQYDVWELKGPRPTLRDDQQASFANRFKALAAAVKPIEVGEFNAAPSVIPPAVVREANKPANGAGSPADLYE